MHLLEIEKTENKHLAEKVKNKPKESREKEFRKIKAEINEKANYVTLELSQFSEILIHWPNH